MLLMDYTLGFTVTFTGIFIVFMMLVLLVVVLSVFGFASQFGAKREAKKLRKAQAKEEIVVEEKPQEIQTAAEGQITPEVIAVISAAVASVYATSGKKPVIKSVKRSGSTMPAWASAGVYNNTRAF